MPVWDPARYLQFADNRTRPFLDLIAQIPGDPSTIVDLGCGPGHLTGHLRTRWPAAHILGVDSSTEMITEAIRSNTDALANYDVADVREWTPPQPVDLLISNALLQWVPDQFAVLDRLLTEVNPGGTVAIGVPNNASSATHTTLDDLASSPTYVSHLRHVRRLPSTTPMDYLEFFAERGFVVNTWETTYLHILDGPDPVYGWISGTGARPFVQALPEDLAAQFVTDLKARLRAAYPARPWGTPLPFRRTFAVATAPG